MKGHIDAIAAKYIRPGEGTYDFAFMYLPAEAIYYELVCGKTGALLAYAHEKRVFPVSATTFTAYLQVIAFGLKGLQIERSAQEVMAILRRAPDGLRPVPRRLRARRQAPRERSGEVQRRRQAARPLRGEARAARASCSSSSGAAEPPALPRALDAA